MTSMTIEDILVRVKNAMKLAEYTLAEALLNKIISLKPDYSLPYMLLGNVYEKTGRLQKALNFYKQSIRINPNNVEAYNNIGIVYKNSQEYQKAIAFLNRALLLNPDRADIYYNLGNVYKETGNLKQAIDHYQKAIEVNSGFIPPYNNLGTVLEMMGKHEQAGQVYSLGLEVDSNNPRLHYNLGIILENQNKFKEAKVEFEHALKVKPGWDDALLNLGVVLSKLSEHNKSINAFQNILKADPENVKAMNNLGIEYGKIKDIEKAKSCYMQALSMAPDYQKAHLNLGTLLENQGDYIGALKEIENLAKENPDDINVRFRLGNIYTALEKYRKAEAQFQYILKQNPDHGETLRALGNLYLRAGKYKAADKCYNQLSKTDPAEKEYHLDFAVLLNDKKEFEKSESEVKKFLASNPDDINALSLLGELYFKQDYLDKAAGFFEEILKKNPNIVKPYYYLAKTYEKMGDTEKAVKTIDRLITLEGTRQTPADMENLGKAITLYETATEEYEKAFKIKLNKNIAHLDDFSFDEGEAEELKVDPDSIYTIDDTETILKTGGSEPILHVSEKVEQIKIVEVEKEPPPVIEIKDSEPLPFTELLKNEELYDNLLDLKAKKVQSNNLQSKLGEVETKLDKVEEDHDNLLKQLQERNKEKELHNEKKADKTPRIDFPEEKKEEKATSLEDVPAEKKKEKTPLLNDYPEELKKMPGVVKDDKGMTHDMLDSLAKKINDLATNTSAAGKNVDIAPNQTLIDVLKNISDALKGKIQSGPFPAFFLPSQKKRRKKKEQEAEQEITGEQPGEQPEEVSGKIPGEQSSEKAKTTRERLREYFRNIRKKLEEDIKIPEDTKKQKYINNLVKQISKPFEGNQKKQTRQEEIYEQDEKSGDIIKEPENIYEENKENSADIQYIQEEEINADNFITHETIVPGEIDLKNELIFEEEFAKKAVNTDLQRKKNLEEIEKNLYEQFEDELKDNRNKIKGKEAEEEKSFKPQIRIKKSSISRTMMVNTLQFLRKILGFLPNFKTGIKTRLDDFIKKLSK